MFDLNRLNSDTSIVDVASGAASFCAEWSTIKSGSCIAVDPSYALPRSELETRVRAGVAQTRSNIELSPGSYRWDVIFDSPTAHIEERTQSAELFLADIYQQQRYIAGDMTALPLRAASADLVLSSHFLFTYASSLPVNFHIQAISEMLRVARREIRIFPIIGFKCDADPTLRGVLDYFRFAGVFDISIVLVEYEFLRGANSMLVIAKSQLE
jgi:ubiquinone/menaquinone biosynthesis C-methylase UbiE